MKSVRCDYLSQTKVMIHSSNPAATHLPCSAGAALAKESAVCCKDLINKSSAAKDISIGQVTDPAAQLLGQGAPASAS